MDGCIVGDSLAEVPWDVRLGLFAGRTLLNPTQTLSHPAAPLPTPVFRGLLCIGAYTGTVLLVSKYYDK